MDTNQLLSFGSQVAQYWHLEELEVDTGREFIAALENSILTMLLTPTKILSLPSVPRSFSEIRAD